jgi:DNA-binding NtrC family response regulator
MAETATVLNRSARLVALPAGSGAIELSGCSTAAVRIQELVRRACHLSTGVLIVGEPGTDAESIAREIHKRGRPSAPWVRVECGAPDQAAFDRDMFGLPAAEQLTDLESVSATSHIATARGGTLFLSDIGELPASAQARLARLFRDSEYRIDGEPTPADMRIVAAATPAIDADVRANRFRGDLFRRVSATRIDLPPLRDRVEDVIEMAEQLLERIATNDGMPRVFTRAALALLGALAWPGNLAELKAVVERVAADCHRDDAIQVEQILPALNLDRAQLPFSPAGNLREARLRFERDYIAAVLQHHGWKMAEAAQTLGIQRPNLYRKARQLGIPVAGNRE